MPNCLPPNNRRNLQHIGLDQVAQACVLGVLPGAQVGGGVDWWRGPRLPCGTQVTWVFKGDGARMEGAAACMSDFKRLGLLWALVLATFLLFNAIYWPIHLRQQDLDPASYMTYAERQRSEGRVLEAINTLRTGIETHHPPLAAPYVTLHAWQREVGHTASAEALAPTVAFYQALAAPEGDERDAALGVALAAGLARTEVPVFSPETAYQVRILATDLGTTLGMREAVHVLPAPEQFMLLRLAGGALSVNGMVGKTEVALPFDLLVQSPGGNRVRRMAHLFLNNHDYGGEERGFHTLLIEPGTGQVAQLGVFDIWLSSDETDRMVRVLHSMPAGTVGAFAVLGDASVNMDEELEAALREFGLLPEAILLRRSKFFGLRFSFAAIGVKGAIPGTAMQAWSPDLYGNAYGHPVACMVARPATPAVEKQP